VQDTPAGDATPVSDPSDEGRERALEALASARKAAAELAAEDDFDGALALVKELAPEAMRLVPDELETATDEIVASARRRVEAIEADVVKQLAASELERARARLAELAKLKAATALPGASDLAEKLKSKIAAAGKEADELAARRAREALDAALAGFDKLMAVGDYDGARKHATQAAEALDKKSKGSKEALVAAAEIAGIFPERQRVLRQKYADLVGARVDIGTRRRAWRGVMVKEVSGEALTVEWKYRIGIEERSRTAKLPWSDLSAKEIESRLADWRTGDPARLMAEAVAALRVNNVNEAQKLLGKARGHPLGGWLARKIKIARRGAAEVAAEEAWEKLLRGMPPKGQKITEAIAQLKIAEVVAFEKEHRSTKTVAGLKGKIDAVKARLRLVMRGKILREWWMEIPGGAVSDLTSHADYPDRPTGSDFLTEFYRRGRDDHYGQRIRGYLHPPVTGDYKFTFGGDDGTEFWLSTDAAPANKVLQKRKNPAATLVAGRRYYVEVLHKESIGHDWFRLGWTRPDAVVEETIPGKYLSPWQR
jgi:hypothetical protein